MWLDQVCGPHCAPPRGVHGGRAAVSTLMSSFFHLLVALNCATHAAHAADAAHAPPVPSSHVASAPPSPPTPSLSSISATAAAGSIRNSNSSGGSSGSISSAPVLEEVSKPSQVSGRKSLPPLSRRVSNTTSILQQARAGLNTAIREVRLCRAQKAQCQDELATCKAGQPVADDGTDSMARNEEVESALAKARSDMHERDLAYAELRKRAQEVTSAAQQQTAQLKQQLKAATSAEAECKLQLKVAAASGGMSMQQQQQQQLQTQLGVLRRKLEEKEQLEDTIETKHSKLTEVYRALESECQAELSKCREGSDSSKGSRAHEPPSASTPSSGADAPGIRMLRDAERTSDECAKSEGTPLLAHARAMVAIFVAGAVVGWAARGPRAGSRSRGGSAGGGLPHVEEMRGWMPVSDSMKIS